MKSEISLELKDGYINIHHKGDITLLSAGNDYEIEDINCGSVSLYTSVRYTPRESCVKIYAEVNMALPDQLGCTLLKDIAIGVALSDMDNFQNTYNGVIKDCKNAIRGVMTDLSETLYELEG